MGAKAEETRTYNNVPMQFFIEKCRAINNAGLNVTLKSENPESNGTVWFRIHHGMTMLSYAEKITVTLKPAGAGTEVNVFSTCGLPTQVIDYGKNRQNVNAIFRYLETGIESAQRPQEQYRPPVQPATPQYQQTPPQAAPQQYQQPAPQPYQQVSQQYQQPNQQTQQRQFSQATQQEIYRTAPQATPQQYQQAAPQQPTPPSAPARDFVFCTQCGSKNPVNSRFCSECGSPIIRIQA